MFVPKLRSSLFFKVTSFVQLAVLSTFFIVPSGVVHAQTFSVFSLPKPGTMVTASEKFIPPLLKGISLHKENPLVFDFIIDPGNAQLSSDAVQQEGQKLIKYFLASLTIPEDDLWVNLSPYENNKIIPPAFGETEMGRDLLAQDYILKQLSASLIYPEKDLGKSFWDRVYQKAQAKYGTTDIPMTTFNKVWIIPDKAVILETDDTAYVVRSRLKVLMEQDYIALNQNRADEVLGTNRLNDEDVNQVSSISSEVVREIIIPEIEREVNEGKNFSQLRQIYNSLILANWFKDNLKENILNQVYSDQAKILGVDVEDKSDKEKIYQHYLSAYRQGVFNYIKEDLEPTTGEAIPRKYFSGGAKLGGPEMREAEVRLKAEPGQDPRAVLRNAGEQSSSIETPVVRITGALAGVRNGPDKAMLSDQDKKLLQNQKPEIVRDVISRFDAKAAGAVDSLTDLRMLQARMDLGIQRFDTSMRDQVTNLITETVRSQIERYRSQGVAVTSSNAWQNETQTARSLITNAQDFDTADVQVIETDRVTFGAAVSDGKLFIERPLLDRTPADSVDNFNQRTRFLIRAISPSILEGDVTAYNYALRNFPQQIGRLYPSEQAMPHVVMQKVRDNLLGYLDPQQAESFRKSLNDARRRIDPNAVEIVSVIEPSADTINKTEQLYNALNLYIYMDASRRLDGAKSDKNVRLEFAFAADPATTAHFLTAGTIAMLITDAKFGGFDPTTRDYRKAYLERTYATRLGLTRDVAREVFGGLIDVLANTPATKDTNGEGRQHQYLIDEVDSGRIFDLDGIQYLAGEDHFLSFARDKKTSQVSFKKITEQNIGDFEAYAMLPGYQRLIQMLVNEDGLDVVPEKHRSFIQGIADGSLKVSDALKVGAEFPDLDVFAKVFLMLDDVVVRIQNKYGEARANEFREKFNYGVVITPREVPQYTDKTRAAILKSGGISFTWGVEGPGADISSTNIRKGLTQLLKSGELNLNEFYGLFRMSLERILIDPAYQKHLLRIGKMQTGESVEELVPVDSFASERERHQQNLARFQENVAAAFPGAVVRETSSESKTDFGIEVGGVPMVAISRTVTSQYIDGKGSPEDIVTYNVTSQPNVEPSRVAAVEAAFKEFSTTPSAEITTTFVRDSAIRADLYGSSSLFEGQDWTANPRFDGVASVIPELRSRSQRVNVTERGVTAILQGQIQSGNLIYVLRGLELLDVADREGALRALDQEGLIPSALSGLSYDAFQNAIQNPTGNQRSAVADLLSVNQRTQDIVRQIETQRDTNASLFIPGSDGQLSSEGSRVKADLTRQLNAVNKLWALLAGIVNPGVVVEEADTVLTGLIPSQNLVRTANIQEAADRFADAVQGQLRSSGTVAENPGGIDLNPANLKIEINKENGGVNVEFDPQLLEQIRQQGIEGFIPVIINVQPMESALPLFSQNVQPSEFATSNI